MITNTNDLAMQHSLVFILMNVKGIILANENILLPFKRKKLDDSSKCFIKM